MNHSFTTQCQNCPPNDAELANGSYFRVGKNNPPTVNDFKSQAELGQYPKADPCMREGLSTVRTLRDAVHLRQIMPGLGKFIYSGELDSSYGKSKLTKGKSPSHTTWWPCLDVIRSKPFRCEE